MTNHRVSKKNNTTDVNCRLESSYPSGEPEVNQFFVACLSGVRVVNVDVFMGLLCSLRFTRNMMFDTF